MYSNKLIVHQHWVYISFEYVHMYVLKRQLAVVHFFENIENVTAVNFYVYNINEIYYVDLYKDRFIFTTTC